MRMRVDWAFGKVIRVAERVFVDDFTVLGDEDGAVEAHGLLEFLEKRIQFNGFLFRYFGIE